MPATSLCRPCRDGRHFDCEGFAYDEAIEESRGFLLEYRVEVGSPPRCQCDCRRRDDGPPDLSPPGPRHSEREPALTG